MFYLTKTGVYHEVSDESSMQELKTTDKSFNILVNSYLVVVVLGFGMMESNGRSLLLD